MDPIKPCQPYKAAVIGTAMLDCPDRKSRFKVYFVDIPGRTKRDLYEWDASGMDRNAWLERLRHAPCVEGVGFVVAFPHITKVFRFGPDAETVVVVRAFHTRDLKDLSLARSGDFTEFACLAEAEIALDEFRLWADAVSVDQYIAGWSRYRGSSIASHDKFARHWESSTS